MHLRILIVSDHYPPFIGGAHRQTQLLAKELTKRGHEVCVATVWHPGLPTEQDDDGVRVYRLKQLRTIGPSLSADRTQRHQPPFPDPITVWGMRRIINRFKPDIIHSYGWFTYSCAAALVGKKIPLLVSARDYAYGCPTRTLVYRDRQLCSGPQLNKGLGCAAAHYGSLKGWAATAGVYAGRPLLKRKIQGIHSISTYVQDMVRRDFLEDRRTDANGSSPVAEVIIPSFLEDAGTSESAADPSIQPYLDRLPKQPFILFVGALRLVKGLHQLLAAYERLVSPPPLVLIGTKEADTPHSFPPGVVVLENYPHRAVMAAWERCLFGAMPSLWPEPLGSVIYEGMSKGKAVIGTTPGGHTDMIIDGETGFLVPLGDVDTLVKALQELIDNADLREQFGRAGRERADLFTAAFAVPRFERIYQQLINGSTGHANESSSLSLGQR